MISLLLTGAIWLTTLDDGATEHVAAWFLRAAWAGWLVLRWGREGRDPTTNFALFGFLTVMLLGVMGAPQWDDAIQIASTCALGALTLYANARPRLTSAELGLASFALSVHAIWAIVERLFGVRGDGGFFNPNQLAALLLVGLALLPIVRTPWRMLTWSLGATWLIGIAATGSRSGILIAAAILALVAWSKLPTRMLAPVAAAIAVVAGGTVYWAIVARGADPYAWSRLSIWQATLTMAKEYWPVGVGLGQYAEAMQQIGVPVSGPIQFAKFPQNAHQEPLQWLAELGVLGLFLWGLGLATLTRWTANEAEHRPLRAGLAIAILGPAMVADTFHAPILVYVAANAFLLANQSSRRCGNRSASHAQRFWRFLPLVVGLAPTAATLSHLANQAAVDARQDKDLETARTWAARATSLNPMNESAWMLRASLEWLHTRDPDATAASLLEIADRFSWSEKPVKRLLWLIEHVDGFDSLDNPRARTRLIEAWTERAPLDPFAWYNLARLQWVSGDVEVAEGALDRALKTEPKCGRCLALDAILAWDRGDEDRAQAQRENAWASHRQSRTKQGRTRTILSLDPSVQATMKLLSSEQKH